MWLVIRMFSLQASRNKWVLLERKPGKELSHLASWGSVQAGPSPTERKKGQWIQKWLWGSVVQRRRCGQTLEVLPRPLLYPLSTGKAANWKELWFRSVLSPKGGEVEEAKLTKYPWTVFIHSRRETLCIPWNINEIKRLKDRKGPNRAIGPMV